MRRSLRFAAPAMIISLAVVTSANTALMSAPVRDQYRPDPSTTSEIVHSFGKLPLSFEANQGQVDARVKFLSHGPGYSLFLTQGSAILSIKAKTGTAALQMKLARANLHGSVTGLDELPAKSNYFIGNDTKRWHSSIPTYASVKYSGVYPGVDLVYHGNQKLLEYDFVVAPGADPKIIEICLEGAPDFIGFDNHQD